MKALARAEAIVRRSACDPALGAALATHVLRDCPPAPGAIIAGFWPLAHEIDTRPLLHQLAATGFKICLPVTPPRGLPLTFRRWSPGDVFTQGRFGTVHTEGEELVPDYILTPLLAFDALGNRLGYGGGYYDRTFAALPNAFRLGCAFAAQQSETVPTEPNDVRLHAIATELGVMIF